MVETQRSYVLTKRKGSLIAREGNLVVRISQLPDKKLKQPSITKQKYNRNYFQ